MIRRCALVLRSITPLSSSANSPLSCPAIRNSSRSALRSRLALPTNRARTVAGRRRNPLATQTLQHEPSDKNKRSSNTTGRREADAATAQRRCRERAARNSHEGEEDRKPDTLSPNFSLGILHFMPLLLNFRSLYRSQKYSLYFYLKSFNTL